MTTATLPEPPRGPAECRPVRRGSRGRVRPLHCRSARREALPHEPVPLRGRDRHRAERAAVGSLFLCTPRTPALLSSSAGASSVPPADRSSQPTMPFAH